MNQSKRFLRFDYHSNESATNFDDNFQYVQKGKRIQA
jgi:hypothetical protein